MSEEEVIKYLKNIKDKDLWIRGYVYGKKAIDTALQLLEQKDTRIDELEKALVDEAIKSTEKIKELNNKINKVKEYCNETIDFKDSFNEGYDDCYDILKILEE